MGVALVAVVAISGLAGCSSSNKTTNSLPSVRPSVAASPAPSATAPGIGTVSYCVRQSPTYQLKSPVTIAIYRGTVVVGRKDTYVGTRVNIPIPAGDFDVIVDNTVLLHGFVTDGKTVSSQTGRFCPAT